MTVRLAIRQQSTHSRTLGKPYSRVLLSLLFVFPAFQTTEPPPYLRQGDRIEQEFRDYHTRLNDFYKTLRETLERDAPELVSSLEGEPPRPVVYGYNLLPKLVDRPPSTDANMPKTQRYS